MKFSVIIPTYNRSWVIREAIDSVLAQDFKDYELIVVDDGSTDETPGILRSYGNKIRLIQQSNSGGAVARNTGVKAAKGDYIAFLDDDDLFFPHTLDVYDAIIEKKNSPPFIAGQPEFFSGENDYPKTNFNGGIQVISYDNYFVKDRSVFASSSMMVIRKDIFWQVDGFERSETNRARGLDDYHLLLKIGIFSPAIIVLSPKLFAYREHQYNSVREVNRVLVSISDLIAEERAGVFAKNDSKRFGRYSVLGGTSFFWIRKGLKKGLVIHSLKLLMKSTPMILVSILKKVKTKLGKMKKEEIL